MILFFFFFKQKTAYEMRISDWSSDVCSSDLPDPVIQEPDDVILRVTATAICGSDLHLYRGKIPATEDGDIFGHEFMGIVEEVGPQVTEVKKDRKSVV